MVGCLIAGSKCTKKNGVSRPGTHSSRPRKRLPYQVMNRIRLTYDLVVELQATAVIPGSHLWPPSRAPKVEECTYAEMEPGSALFTLGCESAALSTKTMIRSDFDGLMTIRLCRQWQSDLPRRRGEQVRPDRS